MRKIRWACGTIGVCGVMLLLALPAAAQDVLKIDLDTGYEHWRSQDTDKPLLLNRTLASSVVLPNNDFLLAARPASAFAPAETPPTPHGSPTAGGLNANMLGFEYQYIRVRGSSDGRTQAFNLHGFDTTYVRWLSSCFGFEMDFGAAFGTPFPDVNARLLFGTAGIRAAFGREHTFWPWLHVGVGGANLRFEETALRIGHEIFDQYIGITPTPGSNVLSDTGVILRAGGGINVNLGNHFILKLAQVDYVYSHLFHQSQHNLGVNAGFYFAF